MDLNCKILKIKNKESVLITKTLRIKPSMVAYIYNSSPLREAGTGL